MYLRDYQEQAVRNLREAYKDHRSVLFQLATGGGKTIIAAYILRSAAEKGNTSWFICHRRELINQAFDRFEEFGLQPGIIASGYPETDSLIKICSIQTLVRRINKLTPPDFIVFDECHHINSQTWARVYDFASKAKCLGLTATPCRLDGKGLGDYFSILIRGPLMTDLMGRGYLTRYKLYAPTVPDMAGIRTLGGDYNKQDLDKMLEKSQLVGDTVEHYKKICAGKKAIIFCASVKHSKLVVDAFIKAGILASHVDGTVDNIARDYIINQFKQGHIQVLSNVDLFGEGFDVPSAEVAILLRPTKSLGLYLQQFGRVLRPSPGKTKAIILDHAGNCLRHGIPEDLNDWSLEGAKWNKAKQKQLTAAIRRCLECFIIVEWHHKECPNCKAVFPVRSTVPDHVDGELTEAELNAIRMHKKHAQNKAHDIVELVKLGIERGYKNPYYWAKKVMENRWKKKYKTKY